jgi:signal transduction histidine kinase
MSIPAEPTLQMTPNPLDQQFKDFLNSLVVLINELLDVSAHTVAIYDTDLHTFTLRWHLLTGFTSKKGRLLKPARQSFLRNILLSESASPTGSGHYRCVKSLGRALVLPLICSTRPRGLLFVWPEPAHGNTEFSEYDVFLARCVITILQDHFWPKGHTDYWTPLFYSILHARQFLVRATKFDQVIHEYLARLIDHHPFQPFPKDCPLWAEVRLCDTTGCEKGTVRLVPVAAKRKNKKLCLQTQSQQDVILSTTQAQGWLKQWTHFTTQLPEDPDSTYACKYPDTKSLFSIPLHHHGELTGVLSIHCLDPIAIEPNLVRLLCIIGAYAAPNIANANARKQLQEGRDYLQSVLDSIPDEIATIDQTCRILQMNAAKRNSYPKAFVGGLCYKQFEMGQDKPCEGCYALQALADDRPISRALWRYTNPNSRKTSFVEISAGRIKSVLLGAPRSVEVVRDVGAREALLEWLQHVLRDLPVPESRSRQWLWRRLAEGANRIGFPRVRVYEYCDGSFQGRLCRPRNTFRHENIDTFDNYTIPTEEDIPSWIVLHMSDMRPVRFMIKPTIGKRWELGRASREWNYIDCNIRDIPPLSAHCLNKNDIGCWAEIPLAIGGRVLGKVSVDKGTRLRGAVDFITDYEMALLSLFGKFASIVLQVIQQAELLLVSAGKRALENLVTGAVHEMRGPVKALDYGVIGIQKDLLPLIRLSLSTGIGLPNSQALDVIRRIDRYLSARRRQCDVCDAQRVTRNKHKLDKILASCGISSRPLDRNLLAELDLVEGFKYSVASSVRSNSKHIYEYWLALGRLVLGSAVIQQSIARTNDLVTALDNNSFLAGGRKRWLDPHATIDSALMCLRGEFMAENITVEKTFQAGPVRIWGVVNQIAQIWSNLLINSVDSLHRCPRRRKIWVATRTTAKGFQATIRDNGIGFRANANLETLGLHLPSVDHGSRRGYGFWVARQAIDNHKGTFCASAARQGEGAHISVTLPCYPQGKSAHK